MRISSLIPSARLAPRGSLERLLTHGIMKYPNRPITLYQLLPPMHISVAPRLYRRSYIRLILAFEPYVISFVVSAHMFAATFPAHIVSELPIGLSSLDVCRSQHGILH
jgi:hypothetical protein